MASLKNELGELVKVDGVVAAAVVSRDGFVIEGMSTSGKLETDAVGAVVSAGVGSAEVMGSELSVGSVTQCLMEYDKGLIAVNFLGDGAVLAIVTDPKANVGNIRYQVKKHSPGIEKAL